MHTGKQWTLYTFSLLRERDTCTDALSSDGTLNQLHCLECYILNIGNLILVLKSIKEIFFSFEIFHLSPIKFHLLFLLFPAQKNSPIEKRGTILICFGD